MKKACLLLLAIILCLSPETQAQILQDPTLMGGSRFDQVFDMQQDKNGNIYVLVELDLPATFEE